MNESDTYILFALGGSTYGIRSADVQHIDMLEHVTAVPNTASAIEGVVFSRGRVIPAMNLRVRFGLPKQPHTPQTRLLFLRVEDRLVALIVDSAREFQRIPPESFRPVSETLHGIHGNYVTGVATVKDRLVLLLDVGSVLDLAEFQISEQSLPAESPSAR